LGTEKLISASVVTQLLDAATNHLPLWLIGIILAAIFLASCELGSLVTRLVHRFQGVSRSDGASLGFIVTAIFALLAFMLATTFSMALNRFDARRMAMANEVDAIGTLYLRAGLLDEPYASSLRVQVRQYAECRIAQPSMSSADMERLVHQCHDVGRQMWETSKAAVQPVRTTALASFTLSAVNDVLNAGLRREIAGRAVIPARVLVVLFMCTIAAAAALGSVLSGSSVRLRAGSGLLLLLYASCFVLILDIDRVRAGSVAVSQVPIQALLGELDADLNN
jgi:hypothetical protein